ncbi:MAG TPA: hypothetical protein VEM15_09150, partial [Thermodesulfobacteriota bacterium]|nr:hypothetical protein [Thermodesulfobacteriota bacterium]
APVGKGYAKAECATGLSFELMRQFASAEKILINGQEFSESQPQKTSGSTFCLCALKSGKP